MSKNTKILLFGPTGVGKTSLLNYLYGSDCYLSKDSPKSVTSNIQYIQGQENSPIKDIILIDCPGLMDTENRDAKNISELIKMIKTNNIKGINAILLLFDVNSPRFIPDYKKEFKILCKLFPINDFWSHVSIVFTKCYLPEKKLKKKIESIKGSGGFLEECLKAVKEALIELKNEDNGKYKNINTPKSFDTYFIDTDLENKNTPENKRTDDYLKSMLKWARGKSFIDSNDINSKIDVEYIKKERCEDKVEQDGERGQRLFFIHQYIYTDYRGKKIKIADPDENWYKFRQERDDYEGMETSDPIILGEKWSGYKKAKVGLGIFSGTCTAINVGATVLCGAATIATGGAAAVAFGGVTALNAICSIYNGSQTKECFKAAANEKNLVEKKVTERKMTRRNIYDFYKDGKVVLIKKGEKIDYSAGTEKTYEEAQS